MSIFGSLFGKKGDGERGGCCGAQSVEDSACDGGACKPAADEKENRIDVKVMGTGCKKCHQLHENALEAAERIDKAIKVEYVTDLAEIAAAGVMTTPALLIDGKIASSGKVLSAAEIEKMLR